MAPAMRIHAPRKLMRALLQRLGDSQAERADSEAAVARTLGIARYFDLRRCKIEEAGIRTIVRLCIAGRQIVRRHHEHADLRRSQGHRAIHDRSRQQLVQAASDRIDRCHQQVRTRCCKRYRRAKAVVAIAVADGEQVVVHLDRRASSGDFDWLRGKGLQCGPAALQVSRRHHSLSSSRRRAHCAGAQEHHRRALSVLGRMADIFRTAPRPEQRSFS